MQSSLARIATSMETFAQAMDKHVKLIGALQETANALKAAVDELRKKRAS